MVVKMGPSDLLGHGSGVLLRPSSSVGQSRRLVSVRSSVRTRPRAPRTPWSEVLLEPDVLGDDADDHQLTTGSRRPRTTTRAALPRSLSSRARLLRFGMRPKERLAHQPGRLDPAVLKHMGVLGGLRRR